MVWNKEAPISCGKVVDMNLLNSNGRLLSYIAHHPNCTRKEIAGGMFLSPITVINTVGQLARAGLIIIDRSKGSDGRVHVYSVRDGGLADILLLLESATEEIEQRRER